MCSQFIRDILVRAVDASFVNKHVQYDTNNIFFLYSLSLHLI